MADNPAVSAWFASRKFGLFLHFGLYAIEGWHEQDQMRRRIPRNEYGKLINRFNPTRFDPEAILDLAEQAGMEYVCLTTKHHDGFCLWDTKQTDFNVMNSPHGRDIVGQLAEACHKRKFPLGLYYSVVDWHQPNYPNQGRHHEIPGPQPGDSPDWEKYMSFLRAQVRELLTGYGEVRHFFWDMNVPKHVDSSVNQMMRSLQPRMVINNRGFDEGDFGTPEREYQESENARTYRFARPTEACNSVGTQSWGYRADEDYYSTAFLIQSMDQMMARGAHYLLNVGPDATGQIPDDAATIVSQIGRWYAQTREAFADTEPCSNLTTNSEVMLTRRGNTLYAHLNNPVRADAVLLPPLKTLPTNATLLNTGQTLECSTEVVPAYWGKNQRFLRIRRLPRHLLGGGETLVIRLDFDTDPTASTEGVSHFRADSPPPPPACCAYPGSDPRHIDPDNHLTFR